MTWEFNQQVAETFVNHARQHIPNYDQVIDKSVSICQQQLTSTSSIIDVGCATGETIRRLYHAGFRNLSGVDASLAMLKYCDYNLARYHHSNRLPNEKYDAVICNWTLHFVQDKLNYLNDISQSLNPGGFLILSEKTSKDTLPIHFYHNIKSKNGVSAEEIVAKAQSLESVMYINDVLWYLNNLAQLGFNRTYIIDANWCFTTFLCLKR